jgi:hypothetical protein
MALEAWIVVSLSILGQEASNFLGESFTKFDTPLVEAVDVPKEAFDCSSMLINSKKLSNAERS